MACVGFSNVSVSTYLNLRDRGNKLDEHPPLTLPQDTGTLYWTIILTLHQIPFDLSNPESSCSGTGTPVPTPGHSVQRRQLRSRRLDEAEILAPRITIGDTCSESDTANRHLFYSWLAKRYTASCSPLRSRGCIMEHGLDLRRINTVRFRESQT